MILKHGQSLATPVLQFYLLCGIRNTSSLVSGGSGHYSKQSGLQRKGHFTTTALKTLVNGSAGVGPFTRVTANSWEDELKLRYEQAVPLFIGARQTGG